MRIFLCATALAAIAAFAPAQSTISNADIIKLAKAGMGEDFILNLVETQGARLSTNPSALVELKAAGVSERVITSVSKKNPSPEKLNTDSLLALSKAGFSDSFIVDLMDRQPGTYATDTSRILELKQAGVSEKVLSQMVSQGGGRELAAGSTISIRMIDAIDSEKNNEGEEFRASLEDPITLGNDVVVQKGADVKVKLAEEKESGKIRGKAELTVEIVSVNVNGKDVPFSTSSVSEYSGSRGARTAKSAAAVGAVGAIIGAIAGGGKGAAIGAGAGAAAGVGAQVFMKGQRVKIPSETVLTFTTSAPVNLP